MRAIKTFGVFFIIGAIVLCFYAPIAGLIYKAEFNKQLTTLNKQLGANNYKWQIEVVNYNYGWFKSSATLALKRQSQPVAIVVNTAEHVLLNVLSFASNRQNPVWIKAQLKLYLPANLSTAAVKKSNDNLMLIANYQINLLGDIALSWHSRGRLLEFDELTIDIANGEGNFKFENAADVLGIGIKLPELMLRWRQYRFRLAKLNLTFNSSHSTAALPNGKLSFSAHKVNYSNGNNKLQINRLQQLVQFSDFNRLSNVKYSVAASELSGFDYAFKELKTALMVRDLKQQNLQMIGELAKQLLSNRQPKPRRNLASFLSVLHDTEVELIYLNLLTEQGLVTAFLRSRLPALELGNKINAYKFSAEIAVPKSFFINLLQDSYALDFFTKTPRYKLLLDEEQQPQQQQLMSKSIKKQLDIVLSQGLINHNKTHYWSTLELNSAMLSLNSRSLLRLDAKILH